MNYAFRIRWALALAPVLFLVSSASLAQTDPGYSYDSNQKTHHEDWMASLPDDVPLTEISIPGTHDTAAIGPNLPGTWITQTQAMDMATQLRSGIRVFDMRLWQSGNSFTLHHGSIYLNGNFDDVLGTVTNYLSQHPGESVLMRVKNEGDTGGDNDTLFERTFRGYVYRYSSYFWENVINNQLVTNPMMGQIRGKIVVLQDFTANTNYGILYNTFSVQDDYALSNGNTDLYSKWLDVKNQLNSANSGSPSQGYINFLSGSGVSGKPIVFPYFVASGKSDPRTDAPLLWTGLTTGSLTGRNEDKWPDFPRLNCVTFFGITTCSIYYEGTDILATDYLTKLNNSGVFARVGILMADFPGPALLDRIIMQNQTLSARNKWFGDFNGDGQGDVLAYSPADSNWWFGTLSGEKQVRWTLAGNTAGFGQLADGRPIWSGNFQGGSQADVLFYSPGDRNWWLGTLNSQNQLTWSLVGNTSGFGQLADGRPFWTGNFQGGSQTDILFYYPGDRNWWLGTLNSQNQLTWRLVGNTSGFGQVADGRPFWTGDFNGDGRTDILFYYPGNGDWFLGSINGQNQLTWSHVSNTSGFGNISGDRFFVGDFTRGARADILFYSISDQNWWLGVLGAGNQFSWSLVDNSSGLGQLADGRPFWTGDFNGDGGTEVLFYYPGNGDWFLGTVNGQKQLIWNQVANTSAYGNVADGRALWVAPFNGGTQTDVLFFSPTDQTWWLGFIGSGNQFSWYSAGSAIQ